MSSSVTEYQTIRLERENAIAWMILNRPEKRNAMNPQMHRDFLAVLEEVEADEGTRVLIITGAGEAWCAGMDLKQYFRELDDQPAERRRVNRIGREGGWTRLFMFPKPTIAMVNGWCFGGAFTRLIACDFAIAAEDAVFGLSEVNWGIFPGGLVSRVVADAMTYRDAMYYIMTGEPFDGKKAAEMRLITAAVPRERLREETLALAGKLLDKNPYVLRAAKEVYKFCRDMDYWQAEEYLGAKMTAMQATDPTRGRDQGIRKFIDEKRYRPGLQAYPED